MVENDQIHNSLREALSNNRVEYAIEIISDDDVDINVRDVTHDLQTVLMKICYCNLEMSSILAIMDAILKKRPDANIQDSWGRTALMHACIANKPSIIEILLDYDETNLAVIDFEGNSALSYAVQNCDVYTIEDLLLHKDCPSLLHVHNAKGHSPPMIAEKSGNKDVLRLLDPYIKRVDGLNNKTPRRRKPRSRDVTKHLPPAYSPSPERRDTSPRQLKQTTPRTTATLDYSKYDVRHTQYPVRECAIVDKCDSAPVVRLADEDRCSLQSSLSLSTPRLTRRHHKQDCLLTETLLLNQNKKLPYFKSENQSADGDDDRPEFVGLRRQRRPSISLPDLRNVMGNLISSGNSTPTTDGGSGSRANSPTVDKQSDDDVFSSSYPTALLTSRRPDKYTCRRQMSDQQITLPDISPGATTLTTPRTTRKGLSSLVRQRKYSNSDDQINRQVVL